MKCPDCRAEVKFQREYCPHCSAPLFGRSKLRTELKREADVMNFWLNAGIF
jgi:predicted amidophosphoribosyltransferase